MVLTRGRQGFTLVELLVVIGIIGVLAGVLMGTFSGAGDSARAAQCMTNLRNLAVAAQNHGMSEGNVPYAGTFEAAHYASGGTRYYTYYGWISGYESSGLPRMSGHFDRSQGQKQKHIGNVRPLSCYAADREQVHYAMTNGALWTYVGKADGVYRCPVHERIANKKGVDLRWSYVLNGRFGFDENGTQHGYATEFDSLTAPDRTLLFAEIPFVVKGDESGAAPENRAWGVHGSVSWSTAGSDVAVDTVLQYDGCGSAAKESIGFNHQSGKKNACAHVCFADGHVGKLVAPQDASDSKLQELTKWLCKGVEVTFDGTQYDDVANTGNN